MPPEWFPALPIIVALVAGLLVWHATRASQARLAIRSRRAQIRSLRGEVRGFGVRGILLLALFVVVLAVALRY